METKIEIKIAGADRILEVSRVLAKCWKASYKSFINEDYLSSLEDDHSVSFLSDGMRNNKLTCIVAEADNVIVGVAVSGDSITGQYPNDGEVISLYAVPEFIGKKVGHLLFEKAQQVLTDLGFTHGIVCVFSENSRAVRFYGSHGFNIVMDNEKINMGAQELAYVVMRKAF